MRICFPFIAQIHQTFHALPLALEISRRHPGVEVHVACGAHSDLAWIRKLAAAYDPQCSVQFEELPLPPALRPLFADRKMAPKVLTLLSNLGYLRQFDALVMPERTTLRFRRLLPRTKFIWTRHGAGDRASGFEKEIARFDFVLMAGNKIEQRLLQKGLIREGHYATGVYAKFDLVRRLESPPLLDCNRQTVIYNPHFSSALSSWPLVGRQVLDQFAAGDRYNLVFAPHIRLFFAAGEGRYAEFERYRANPHMLIDLGSPALADMTYTRGADIYLGDVSSQVAEFLALRTRPCVFLNPRRTSWQANPNYRFWELGQVIDDIRDLPAAITAAPQMQPQFEARQRQYVAETFGDLSRPSAPAGADAICNFLEESLAGTRTAPASVSLAPTRSSPVASH